MEFFLLVEREPAVKTQPPRGVSTKNFLVDWLYASENINSVDCERESGMGLGTKCVLLYSGKMEECMNS